MARRARRRFVRLVDRLQTVDPQAPLSLITEGQVMVDGRIMQNPHALVAADAAVVVQRPAELKGTLKLRFALGRSGVDPAGRVCLDLGASAGGFTTALVEAGASKVYAADTGFGQLSGRLRQDPRVVNLECTNLADLDRRLVPAPVEVLTVDLSYLPLGEALGQLGGLSFDDWAELLGLVKPTFELRLGRAVTDPDEVAKAVEVAAAGAETAGWVVLGELPAPRLGRAGALEVFLHATRG
jgi:23S rRNA (cytidine1920-2'-O)/16S rRNA (cytidine1409-2'-O)-methyltransferase